MRAQGRMRARLLFYSISIVSCSLRLDSQQQIYSSHGNYLQLDNLATNNGTVCCNKLAVFYSRNLWYRLLSETKLFQN